MYELYKQTYELVSQITYWKLYLESIKHPVFVKFSRMPEKLWWLISFHTNWSDSQSSAIFARELSASGDSNTAILFLHATYICIEKKFKICFSKKVLQCLQKRTSCQTYEGCGTQRVCHWHPWPVPCRWENNDIAFLNKHLSKKENCISKWSYKNDILVLDGGFRKFLHIFSPYFCNWEKRQKQLSVSEANASRLVTKIRWAVISANDRIKR